LAALGWLGLALALPAQAALGGSEATVFADQSHTNAALTTAPGARYTVHQLQVPAGATVREFVGPDGVVFAVAWQGPVMPDLRQLLGPYFGQYVDAVAARRGVRGPVAIALPGLVVESSGRQRAFSGRAYVPGSVPPGVAVDDLR
jgi:hypothetical protein